MTETTAGRTLAKTPTRRRLVGAAALLAPLALVALLVTGSASAVPSVTIARTSGSTLYVDTTSSKTEAAYVSYDITNSTGATIDDAWVRADSFTSPPADPPPAPPPPLPPALASHEDGLVHLGQMTAGQTKTAFFYLQDTSSTGHGSHTIRVYSGDPGAGGSQVASSDFSLAAADTTKANANKVTQVTVSPTNPALGGLITVTVQGETGTIGSDKTLYFTPAADTGFPADAVELQSTSIAFQGGPTEHNLLLIPSGDINDTANTAYTATYVFKATGTTTTSTQMSPVGYILSGSQMKHTDTDSFSALTPIQPISNTITVAAPAGGAGGGTVGPSALRQTVTLAIGNSSNFAVSFDNFRATLPAGVGYHAGTSELSGDPTTDPNVAGRTLTWSAPYTIPANGTQTLSFDVDLPAVSGSYTVDLVAHAGGTQIDTTTNTSDNAPFHVTFVVDATAPTPHFTSTPPSPNGSTGATVGFTSDDASATYSCNLDGGDWNACTSPFTASGLADGPHSLQVRASDTLGNQSAPITAAWTVDTELPAGATPPDLTFDGVPSDSASTAATISFHSDAGDLDHFECNVDLGGWNLCSSPLVLTNLGAVRHTVQVRAYDTDRNESDPIATSWNVDRDAPDLTIDSAPTDSTSTDATIGFHSGAADLDHFECFIEGGWNRCSSPLHLTDLSPGVHVVRVEAVDTFENASEPQDVSWTVTTPAEPGSNIVIDSVPTDGPATSASIGFHSEGPTPDGFECAVDEGGWSACTSPLALTGLTVGPHTVLVRVAVLGGGGPWQTVTWTITGATPPDLILDAAPTDGSATDAVLEYHSTAEDVEHYECNVDGAGWRPCGATLALNHLTTGQHTVSVRSVDTDGAFSDPVAVQWTVTGTPEPTLTIVTTPPTSGHSTAMLGFSSGAGDHDHFDCNLDGGGWTTCASPLELTDLAVGPHTVDVRDAYRPGNVGDPVTVSWTVIDTWPPDVVFDGPPADGTATHATVVFHTTASDLDRFECSVDGGGWTTCSSPLVLSGLAVGAHTVFVRAADTVGNLSAPQSVRWTIRAPVTPPPPPADGAPKVVVTTSSSVSQVAVGEPASLLVDVGNVGTADAGGVVVTIQLPGNAVFVSATVRPGGSAATRARLLAAAGCAADGRQLTCNLGRLVPGQHYTITIVLRATRAGELVSTVSAGGDGTDGERPQKVRQHASRCTIVGTAGNDVLRGTRGNDVICGRAGNDRITGGSGNDLIYGGAGNDRLYGGAGRDRIEGLAGNDLIYGGAGNDRIGGGPGADRAYGLAGNDLLVGGTGRDRLYGGSGNDRVVDRGTVADVLAGGRGRDTAWADPSDTLVSIERLIGHTRSR